MKQNVLLVVLVVAVAALTVVVVRQREEIANLKQPATVATAKRAVPVERPAAAPVKEEAEPPAAATPVAPAPTSTPAPASASSGSASNFMSGLAGMMKSPQMKEMVRAQQKGTLDITYGSLFKYLNLPADQIDSLKQLLLDRQMALMDAGMAMMGGTAAERKQAMEDSKPIKAEYDKKIQDLLGTDNYDVFKQYEATASERMQVQMFKGALPAEAALTEQQEGDLILAMQEERKAMPALANMNNQNADPSQFTEERMAEMLKQLEQVQQRYADRAAAILNPAQLEQFKKFQQQWAGMQAAGLKMAAQMFGQNKPSATPAPSQTPPP